MKALVSAPHRALLGAIRAAIRADGWFGSWLADGPDGPGLVIEEFASEPWASLTFTGARHRLAIRLRGEEAAVERAWDRLEALLTAPDLPLAGHFLADFEIGERTGVLDEAGNLTLTIRIEALTIEE
ncbi:hypothetical protein [Thermaurantiacus sp.]